MMLEQRRQNCLLTVGDLLKKKKKKSNTQEFRWSRSKQVTKTVNREELTFGQAWSVEKIQKNHQKVQNTYIIFIVATLDSLDQQVDSTGEQTVF